MRSGAEFMVLTRPTTVKARNVVRSGRPDTWGTCVMLLRPDRLLHGA